MLMSTERIQKRAYDKAINRIQKWIATAIASREATGATEQHKLMMAGKVKAYTEVVSYLKSL